MPLPRTDVEQALERKLRFDRQESDHRYFTLEIDGRVVARTKTSHGTKHREIGDQLVGTMARQLHVSRSQFEAVVRCTRSRDEYLAALRERGFI